jgi:hypothetical protein
VGRSRTADSRRLAGKRRAAGRTMIQMPEEESYRARWGEGRRSLSLGALCCIIFSFV